jgi:hypothetical protein
MNDRDQASRGASGGASRGAFRIDIDRQRKRAKALQRALRAADPAALARLRAHHPRATEPGAGPPRLADAQLVVARELGLPSWPRLKAHADAMERAGRAIASGAPAPDADVPTLHIRCGGDIRGRLREAGFAGDFLEHSNPYCQGPLPAGADLAAVRARFVADAYGAAMGLTEAAALDRLRAEEEALARAGLDHPRVVLWMEHDSHDQLVLARCLARFAEAGAPPILELVSANRFPGSERFVGLGQLPAEALRLLWERRRPLSRADLDHGRRAWDALRDGDPRPLADLARQGARSAAPGLPDLGPALARHLRELPWTSDGLSLTERLVLGILADGRQTVGRVFSRLTREVEPMPWLGDVMLLPILEGLARARVPALSFADAPPGMPPPSGAPWAERPLDLTEAGRAVLAGEADWLSLGPPGRWVGGVRIGPGGAVWRWDEAAGAPARR